MKELTPEYKAAYVALQIARANYDARQITKAQLEEAEEAFRQIREALMREALEVA